MDDVLFNVLFRLAIVWVLLHIILFFVEMYRYKHSNWSWYGFKNNGMLDITYIILFIDVLGVSIAIMSGLGYWIFQPIIK
jgi:H+/Cl- antiporter ClcA